MTIEEARRDGYGLALKIEELLQEFHNRTGVDPEIDISTIEVTAFGDKYRRYKYEVRVTAFKI